MRRLAPKECVVRIVCLEMGKFAGRAAWVDGKRELLEWE